MAASSALQSAHRMCGHHDGRTWFYLRLATGVRVKKVMDLKDDLAMSLATRNLNMELAPEKQAIAIDIPD